MSPRSTTPAEDERLAQAVFVVFTSSPKDLQSLDGREGDDTFHWSGDARMRHGDRVLIYFLPRKEVIGTGVVARTAYYNLNPRLWRGVGIQVTGFRRFARPLPLAALRKAASGFSGFRNMMPQRFRDPARGRRQYYANALLVPEPHARRVLAVAVNHLETA